MNVVEALEETWWAGILNKLEELARSSGKEGDYAVDRYLGGIVNVALLDPDGHNVEVGFRDNGLLSFAMWYADGRDTSLSERGQDVEEAVFYAIIDERIGRFAATFSR